jgi:hypothetical protein
MANSWSVGWQKSSEGAPELDLFQFSARTGGVREAQCQVMNEARSKVHCWWEIILMRNPASQRLVRKPGFSERQLMAAEVPRNAGLNADATKVESLFCNTSRPEVVL